MFELLILYCTGRVAYRQGALGPLAMRVMESGAFKRIVFPRGPSIEYIQETCFHFVLNQITLQKEIRSLICVILPSFI